jgi:hypothetical protein
MSLIGALAIHDATGRLPHLTSWLAHPAGLPPDEQFSLGLGFLLDGIARCLAGAETQARSDTMGRVRWWSSGTSSGR